MVSVVMALSTSNKKHTLIAWGERKTKESLFG
jgi:hypothetical protein